MMVPVFLVTTLLCMCVSGGAVNKQSNREILPGVGAYYFHAVAMNWTDGERYCRVNRKESLAYPNTPQEAAFMVNMIKSYNAIDVLAGFHDQFSEKDYYTLSGTPLSKSCFKTWYKETGGTDINCGAFGTNSNPPGIFDVDCSVQMPFICVNYNYFKDDYDFLPGYGYYKKHQAQRLWFEAQRTCEAEGSNLLVLNSEGELNALSTRYGQFTAWVGAHHIHDNWQFISIFDESLADTGFSRWESGQPSGTNVQNPYLIVNSAPGIGLALRPASDVHSFICEIPAWNH